MSSQHDKSKPWQFGMREAGYVMTLLCAVFATMPIGTATFFLLAPLYLAIFLAVIGKPEDALITLILWSPFAPFMFLAAWFQNS